MSLKKAEKLHKTYINGTKKAIEYNGANKVYVDYRFDGTTTGDLGLAATLSTYAVNKTALFVSMKAGLSGNTQYSLSAGVAWTMPVPEF